MHTHNSLKGLSALLPAVFITCIGLGALADLPDIPEPVPPPIPAVPPTVTYPFDLDADLDHVDDAITERLTALRSELAGETDPARRAEIMNRLQEPIGVEMLFAQQITQADIRAFLDLGGLNQHLYRHVSYGWGGTIPLDRAP